MSSRSAFRKSAAARTRAATHRLREEPLHAACENPGEDLAGPFRLAARVHHTDALLGERTAVVDALRREACQAARRARGTDALLGLPHLLHAPAGGRAELAHRVARGTVEHHRGAALRPVLEHKQHRLPELRGHAFACLAGQQQAALLRAGQREAEKVLLRESWILHGQQLHVGAARARAPARTSRLALRRGHELGPECAPVAQRSFFSSFVFTSSGIRVLCLPLAGRTGRLCGAPAHHAAGAARAHWAVGGAERGAEGRGATRRRGRRCHGRPRHSARWVAR